MALVPEGLPACSVRVVDWGNLLALSSRGSAGPRPLAQCPFLFSESWIVSDCRLPPCQGAAGQPRPSCQAPAAPCRSNPPSSGPTHPPVSAGCRRVRGHARVGVLLRLLGGRGGLVVCSSALRCLAVGQTGCCKREGLCLAMCGRRNRVGEGEPTVCPAVGYRLFSPSLIIL